MPILAIDTASRWTAIGIYDEESDLILADRGWMATMRQTVELAPAISGILSETGITPADLTGISVAIGPGSYTGLRIGLGVAKGLALVHNIPIIPVKTHDIVAANIPYYLERLLVAVEAGRKRVLIAPYAWENDRWTAAGEIDNPTWPELLESIEDDVVLAGEVPDEVAELIGAEYKNMKVLPKEIGARSAAVLAKLGATKLAQGDLLPNDQVVPEYLRQP